MNGSSKVSLMSSCRLLALLVIMISVYSDVPAQSSNERIIRIPVKLPGAEDEKILDVTVRNGKLFLDDDIYLGEESMLRMVDAERSASLSPVGAAGALWPDNVVPFNLTNSHPERSNILQAMTHIASRTSITFVPRTNEQNYLSFSAKDDGCYSAVGMIGGEQFINMQSGCGYPTAIHELGHALGLFHEQSRTDRDEYVTIKWDNIISGKEFNFQKYIERGQSGIDFDVYDYESIMHYSARAFSINGQPTIEIKTPPAPSGTVIGSGRSLSKVDILSINNLYRVIQRSTSEIKLTDEIATFPNPPCIGTQNELSVSLEALDPDILQGIKFQYALHDFRNGAVIERLGEPFELDAGQFSSNINVTVKEASKGNYLLVLWQLGEEGNLEEVINDGDFLNGRRIELVDDCVPSVLDPYEDNDQEVLRYEITPPVSDSSFVFSSAGSTIHSIQDVDYYHIKLKENVNYIVEADVSDVIDDKDNFSNDVVFDYKVEGKGWRGYNDRRLTINDLYNGTDISFRVRSHFPDDTGSYQLNLTVEIDPESMLLTGSTRYTIEAEDTVYKIPVLSNRKWNVLGESDFIKSITVGGYGYDTITVVSEKNHSFDSRDFKLTVITEDEEKSVEVILRQQGVQRTLSTEYSRIPLCREGSEGLLWVNSNADWYAEAVESWIQLIDSEGTGDGWVRFSYSSNLTNNTRNGEIILYTDGIQRKVKVEQPGQRTNINACIDPIYIEVSPEEGNIDINVNTNVAWEILNKSDMLTSVSPLAGNGASTIEISHPSLGEGKEEEVYRIDVAVGNSGVFTVIILQTEDFSSSTADSMKENVKISIINPLESHLDIKIYEEKFSKGGSIEMRTTEGQLVLKEKLETSFDNIISYRSRELEIPSGLYFIIIHLDNKRYTQKVIKI